MYTKAFSKKVDSTCLTLIFAPSQLRKVYGKEKADIIMNVAGKIISGQLQGEAYKSGAGETHNYSYRIVREE